MYVQDLQLMSPMSTEMEMASVRKHLYMHTTDVSGAHLGTACLYSCHIQ